MPDIDGLEWITGAILRQRWPFADAFELAMMILNKGLPAFDPISREFIVPTLHDHWLLKEVIADEGFIENLRFRER